MVSGALSFQLSHGPQRDVPSDRIVSRDADQLVLQPKSTL